MTSEVSRSGVVWRQSSFAHILISLGIFLSSARQMTATLTKGDYGLWTPLIGLRESFYL